MNKADDNFDLISQMVNETFNHADNQDYESETKIYHLQKTDLLPTKIMPPVQLEFHFDSFLGAYDQDNKSYIFQVEGQVIEFPQNWGPFTMCVYEQGQVGTLFELNQNDDIYCLIDIFSELIGKPLKSLKLENQGHYLSFDYLVEDTTGQAEVIQLFPEHLAVAS